MINMDEKFLCLLLKENLERIRALLEKIKVVVKEEMLEEKY